MFANELKNGYQTYLENKGWENYTINDDTTDVSKIAHKGDDFATTSFIKVEDDEAFDYLKTEGGFHRVQRIPFNSKTIQTSTASLEVTPIFSTDSDGEGLFQKNLDKVVDYMQKSNDIKIDHF